MLVTPQNGNVYLDAFDQDGNRIGYVCSADPDQGFVLIYTDIRWDDTENKFKLKSMKVQRFYTKFTIGSFRTDNPGLPDLVL